MDVMERFAAWWPLDRATDSGITTTPGLEKVKNLLLCFFFSTPAWNAVALMWHCLPSGVDTMKNSRMD